VALEDSAHNDAGARRTTGGMLARFVWASFIHDQSEHSARRDEAELLAEIRRCVDHQAPPCPDHPSHQRHNRDPVEHPAARPATQARTP